MGRAQSSVTDHSQVSGKLFVRVSGEGGVCIWLLSMLDMCTRPSVPGRGFPGGEHAVCVSLVKQETTGHPESVRPAGAVNTLYLSCGRTQESQSSSLRNEGKWHFRCIAGSLCQWVLHPANVGAKILNKLYLC